MWAGPGQRKERGGWPVQGLGPTGVSGSQPQTQKARVWLSPPLLGPLGARVGDTSQASSPSSPPQPLLPPAPPRCAPRAGGWATEYRIRLETHKEERPSTRPGPPRPYLAFPVAATTPCPARLGVSGGQPGARPGGCAAPGDAGSRTHGGRRKRRSAPPAGQSAEPRFLPLCGSARPPSAPGTPGGGEHPPAGSPALTSTPHPHAKVPGSEGSPPRGPPWMLGAGGPAGDNPPHLDCRTPAPPSSAGASICCDLHRPPPKRTTGHRRSPWP